MALAEIDRFGRHHDPHAIRWKNHVAAAKARAIAAIRAADAPSSRRTVTRPTIISAREICLAAGGSGVGISTTMAANSTASSGAGKTSLPCRANVRHDYR
ncbi:hypothetical protein [Rhizobium sp. Root483D2]|uniref:hypothetical protein n=1 Tax=Rhizobium sp. Root483D2 TaxID=1736545 RepID=UPI001FCD14A7|nr:hypothetical protein [Rhizobium sp. Root483D2]